MLRGLLLILAAATYAQDRAIPAGAPPAPLLAAIPKGFTLNAEVLERYGYTLDQYNALDTSERGRVTDWIEVPLARQGDRCLIVV